MLICRHPTGSTRNVFWPAKKFFWCSFLFILAMLILESKVNFLFFLLHDFLLSAVFCTDFTTLRYTRSSNKSMQSWCCKRLRDIKCSVSFRFHKGVWIFFDKNSLILGTKLHVLKSFLLSNEREVQFRWENPLFFVASMLRAS